ncbi:MAG: hypothetical protein KTR14_08675 [Vampirovibrio sp.]|nr:hypothetical protein [Vampirovibrio sp.]
MGISIDNATVLQNTLAQNLAEHYDKNAVADLLGKAEYNGYLDISDIPSMLGRHHIGEKELTTSDINILFEDATHLSTDFWKGRNLLDWTHGSFLGVGDLLQNTVMQVLDWPLWAVTLGFIRSDGGNEGLINFNLAWDKDLSPRDLAKLGELVEQHRDVLQKQSNG